jgi:phage shock protein A
MAAREEDEVAMELERTGPDKTGPDQGEGEQPAQNTKKAKFPCIRCKKNVTKNSKSVRCGTCQLWVHVECEKISTELFNILAHPDKYGGVSWNCESCLASTARLEALVKTFASKIQQVEERVGGTEGAVRALDRKVDKMEKVISNRDEEVDKKVKKSENTVFEEMRERETRRMNVVFHKVGECENERASGFEKLEWDRMSCCNVFRELRLDMDNDSIKFCRRLGERKEGPRPMVVGFFLEADRSKLLRKAKDLEKTKFKDINIGPDLTKRQREEEADMKTEAERRNGRLTEDDREKNLEWAVVGARGERRLVKTTARATNQRGAYRGRGGRATAATAGTMRGGRHSPRRGGAVTEGRYSPPPRNRDRRQSREREEESEEESSQPPTASGRRPSKRRERSTEEVEGQPPEARFRSST